ncbi:MAG: O-methyltransferase [Thermoproteota archaeon]
MKDKEKRRFDHPVILAHKVIVEEILGSILKEETLRYLGRCVSRYFQHFAKYVLEKQYERCNSIEDIVNLAISRFFGVNIKPQQVKEEIIELLNILKVSKPKAILEIGTAAGGTFLFSKIAPQNSIIISLDIQDESGFYPSWKTNFYRSFSRGKQKLYLLRADSHNIKTVRQVQKILGKSKVDFAFIDDHSYEGVMSDFQMYLPLINKGGIIAFHDIVYFDRLHDSTGTIGVSKFWSEIRERYEYLEIVKDWNQGWGGIGVLYV